MTKKDTTPHKPSEQSRSEVELLASFGVVQANIAKHIGVDPKTLRKHYSDELDKAKIKAHAAVGKFLFKAASGMALKEGATYSDCLRAAIFYAKTQMGWREEDESDTPESITNNYYSHPNAS